MNLLVVIGVLAGVVTLVVTLVVIMILMARLRPASSGLPAGADAAPVPSAKAQTVETPPITPKIAKDVQRLEESRNLLFRLIGDLGNSIQHLVRMAATYDAGLADHQARLQVQTGDQAFDRICEKILSELQTMREANATYKAELADTQEKLSEREAEIASLQLDMNTDFLTRILNRRGIENRISEEIARAKRYNTPFSVALFDIDLFKGVNDEHGHAAGDKVIRLVAHTLEELKRTNDAAGRYGGEEFMLLLPAATSEQAMAVAERARRQMERFVTRFNDARIRVTLSGGVAEYQPDSDTAETLIQRVDKGLYAAKKNGRNCIEYG